MIPIRLKLSGFLSYRDPVEVDFTTFDLACISGPNGAGKSSLLDAITWGLFGEARQRGEALINTGADAAEVVLTFEYEQNQYRIFRRLPRGKNADLQFQIRNGDEWRALTEKTNRDTQARIETILRLDYETFVNASFFLQGKADQFTQQKAGDRKRILGNILGLEIWEQYRERAADRRKSIEREMDTLNGRLAEVEQELAEESQRRGRLSELEQQLGSLSAVRATQESAMEGIKLLAASLSEKRRQLQERETRLARLRQNQASLQGRFETRRIERDRQASLLERAVELEQAFRDWQQARASLEKFESLAGQFRDVEKRRQPFLDDIQTERARLEQEKVGLLAQEQQAARMVAENQPVQQELDAARLKLDETTQKIDAAKQQETHLVDVNEKLASLAGENTSLKSQMNELDARRKQLKQAGSGVCPLCGQPLTDEHLEQAVQSLTEEGTALAGRYKANNKTIEILRNELEELKGNLSGVEQWDGELRKFHALVGRLEANLTTSQQEVERWNKTGQPRLQQVTHLLDTEEYKPEARQALQVIDTELTALGYDPAAHDSARQAEYQGRAVEQDYLALQSARAALTPLEDELASLEQQLADLQKEIDGEEDAYASQAAALAANEEKTPNFQTAERELLDLRERENQALQEVSSARQMVLVLDSRRKQKAEYTSQREELALQAARHKSLERAFGKDGVPAILIEQALPELETKANELLDRLSNGNMSVRFVTQAEYKDKKRDDLKETLDIQISDSAGTRDYEMFSGGEAFRVNFAVRLALSELLARRAGARLQTLVIDEGFGTQDPQGRQRLIEAINLVKADFAKILIITHMEELKEAFPHRIEVDKTASGSTVRVI